MTGDFKKGFTLLEIIIVLAILLVIGTIVFANLSNFKNKQVINGATADLNSFIYKAKSLTLESFESSQYGVRFEPNEVYIFKGSSYTGSNIIDTVVMPEGLTVETGTITVPGDVVYERLTGDPSVRGSVVLKFSSYSSEIIIR